MKEKKQPHSVGNLFVTICKFRRNKTNILLSKAGIHAGQDALLYYLSVSDGQTMSELVEKLCVQHATISNMIDRMVSSGMVIKEKDGIDKRISRVYLTETGRQSVHQVATVWRTLEALTIKGLSTDEVETLCGLLQKVMVNLK